MLGALNAAGKTIIKAKKSRNHTELLFKNLKFEIPDYLKIDVDGLEHLILEGGNQFLNDEKIKSISIEINENYQEQLNKVKDLMQN